MEAPAEPDPFDHPDLRDPQRARQAERNARKGARKGRREAKKVRKQQVENWGRQPKKRFRRTRAIALVVVVLAVAGGGIYLIQQARDDQPVGTYADRPAADPIDLNRPFADTPAHDWAEGADAIVVPKAVAVGGFTAERVARAYDEVKAMLVASRLDPRMIEHGEVEPFLALLAEGQREEIRGQFREAEWPAPYATRIAPGFRLLAAPPRINGTMIAEPGPAPGSLRVRTNYVFAYAFDVDDPREVPAPLDLVAVFRADVSYLLYEGERWVPRDRGYFLDRAESFTYSMSCEAMRKGLLAPAYSDRTALGLPDSRRPPEYFDHTKPIPDVNTCGAPEAG
ncbi:hypothetical protein BA062_32805 [Prauserella flavalba]|uniref:Uncharacterized protein n=1 Tax=Prauserella flavalba TaxID=1477506 RepID=A0A318LC01_9PSEU|nr:hypothetical protein BA062_32805 [Prauserella flavalba]